MEYRGNLWELKNRPLQNGKSFEGYIWRGLQIGAIEKIRVNLELVGRSGSQTQNRCGLETMGIDKVALRVKIISLSKSRLPWFAQRALCWEERVSRSKEGLKRKSSALEIHHAND